MFLSTALEEAKRVKNLGQHLIRKGTTPKFGGSGTDPELLLGLDELF